MLLQLIPPSGCGIPASLQTHAVPTPSSFPRGLKQPANWTRTRTTLNTHGIALPTHQCIDRASWLSLAVEQVTWNLEDDVLVVAFVDGSVERWPIAAAASPLSTQASLQLSNARDTRKDNAEQAEQIQDTSNYERAAATLLVPANESSKSRDSCSAPLSSLSSSSRESWCLPSPPSSSTIKTTCPLTDPSTTQPLRNLCSQLGTAYEKFVMSGTHDVADDDLEHIVTMAGDATVAPLPQWEPDASIGVPSGSVSGSSPPRSDDDRDGEQALSHPTEPTAVMPFPGIFPPRSAPTLEEVRPSEHQREHLRSAWGEAVRKVKSGVPEAEGAVGVHVPLLSILKTIRITMLDLFSRVLAPAIKERLDAPTYCVWATSNAAKAARARAIVRAGEVAWNILALLNDDGQTFDAGSDDTSESESESDDHEDPGGVEIIDQLAEEEWRGVDDFGASTAFELGRRKRRTALKERRIHEQLSNNVMRECFDDFELRLWCEQAIGRAQMMEDSGHTSEEWGKPPGVPHPRVSATSVGPWTWARNIPSWEITRLITSDIDIPKVTIKRRSVLLGPHGSGVTSKNEPDETGEDPSTSPPATDLSDSEGQDCSPKRRPPVPAAMIALEDPLGEELLPPRIPKALVTNARDPYLGNEMIAMRRKTHQSLNQVAGVSALRPHSESGVSELTRRIPTQLIRKAKDLRDYLARQLIDWDKQQVKEKALKPPQDHQKSCLRNPTTSDSPTVESKRVGSSKAQPLIQRAADRSVSRHVRNELERRRRSGSISKKAEASITKHRNTPRKRQRENLDIIDMIENAKSPARKLPKQATNTPSPDKVTDENFGSQQTSTMSQDSEPNILDRSRSPWSNLPSFPWAATTGTSAQPNRPPRSHFTSVDDNRESGATSTSTSSTTLEDSVAPAERFSIQEFRRFRPHPVEHIAATDLTLENKSPIEDVPTVRRGPHSWDRKYPYGEDGDEEMRLLGDGEDDSEEEVVELRLTRLSDVDDESESVDTGSQTQGKRHTPSGILRVSQGLAEQGSISSQWVLPRPRSSWRTGVTPRSTPRDDGNSGPEVLEQRKAADHCGVTSDDLKSSEFSKETPPRPQEDGESSDIEVEVESPEAPAWIHSLRAPLVDTTWRSERSVPPSAEEMGTSAVISGTR
ncbi:BZ3500_MvSof-1268-A1-R1_Chr3-1g05898 [Microbotryum saponariae]|uniref:BZ3500_MvSof-1268-A1-R1_Chr3-1g05898 protein n=1 Tax=Microbotryum saponariae TaxID=289078 RepID=A0A2X0L316_9BASI|nr:BZ3500_MvSof-1268-A1-R1_Chr3-1g05898 [Microbotryum saponariae]SDA05088.1 BZ3501_MvSof-1269-A2-R1_Chr3-1g05568 [Microbotryum saponariae]